MKNMEKLGKLVNEVGAEYVYKTLCGADANKETEEIINNAVKEFVREYRVSDAEARYQIKEIVRDIGFGNTH